jgi:preprotein translocase subunit SecE
MIKKVQSFGAEVRQEMQKVTWPSREELMGSTGVVLGTMLLLSVFIGVVDFIMTSALSLVLR